MANTDSFCAPCCSIAAIIDDRALQDCVTFLHVLIVLLPNNDVRESSTSQVAIHGAENSELRRTRNIRRLGSYARLRWLCHSQIRPSTFEAAFLEARIGRKCMHRSDNPALGHPLRQLNLRAIRSRSRGRKAQYYPQPGLAISDAALKRNCDLRYCFRQ
jgi:hypothetical protein